MMPVLVKNKKIVKTTLLKKTNIFYFFNKNINKNKIQDQYSKEMMEKTYEKYKNRNIIDFFKLFLSDKMFENTCELFYLSYRDIMDDLNIKSMFGWTYFLHI